MTEFSDEMMQRAAEGSRMIGTILEVADVHFREPGKRMAEASGIVDLARHSRVYAFDYDPEAEGQVVRQKFCLTEVPENWDGTLSPDQITLIPYLDQLIDEVEIPEFGPDRIGGYIPGQPYVSMRRLDSELGQGLLGMFEYSMAHADRQLPLPRFSKDPWDDMDIYRYTTARLQASTLVIDTLCELDSSGSTTEWVSDETAKRPEYGKLTRKADGVLRQEVCIPADVEPVASPPEGTAAAELWVDLESQQFVADNIIAIGLAARSYRDKDFSFLKGDEPPEDEEVLHSLSAFRSSQIVGLYWKATLGIKY